jgi:mitochondrial import receptor subunit TOM40
MGNLDVPTNNQQSIKMPVGTYEFGANLVNSKVPDEV